VEAERLTGLPGEYLCIGVKYGMSGKAGVGGEVAVSCWDGAHRRDVCCSQFKR
jgi:hypothetical protein